MRGMNTFVESEHPRAKSGEFVNKQQSAPEGELSILAISNPEIWLPPAEPIPYPDNIPAGAEAEAEFDDVDGSVFVTLHFPDGTSVPVAAEWDFVVTEDPHPWDAQTAENVVTYGRALAARITENVEAIKFRVAGGLLPTLVSRATR